MSASFFLYGATRSGKTHGLLTMRPAGRMIVGDVEGQITAEAPDAYVVKIPPPLPPDATDLEKEARVTRRNEVLAQAREHDLIVWPVLNTNDELAMTNAVQSGRMGAFATVAVDSLTYLFDRLIAEICGISIIHRKGDTEEDAIDPVMFQLPDFSGQGVRRSMELKDWQRFAQKAAEIVTGLKFMCASLDMNLIVTALEEKRDIYEGEGRAKRFVRTQQGPLLRGRISAEDLPPTFMYYFRMTTKIDEEKNKTIHAAQTAKRNGWPAGVRGTAAQILKPFEQNPNLFEMLTRLGLAESCSKREPDAGKTGQKKDKQ